MSVRVSAQGAVCVVHMDRPQRRNAVDRDMAVALYEAFVAFERNPDWHVAVLHGEGGHFCAGWDLQSGAALAGQTPEQRQTWVAPLDWRMDSESPGPLGPMGPTRLRLSKPVIAAVSGAAVAGGLELACWCDMRVVECSAYFGVYCRRFGVPLIDGGTVRLPRLIGHSRAMDMILTGRRVDAQEALSMGLANRVVEAGQGLTAALELAQQLCAFPQTTLRQDRDSALRQWGLSEEQAMQAEWVSGRSCIAEGIAGAVRFDQGQGRHGAGV
jgi:enoyl-CoA hydratase